MPVRTKTAETASFPKIRDSLMDRLLTEAERRKEKPKTPKPTKRSLWGMAA